MLGVNPGFQVWFRVISTLLFAAGGSLAEVYTIDSAAEWQNWQIPEGLVQFSEQGYLQVTRFRKNTNAVSDAPLFVYPTLSHGEVRGGIWHAGTNRSAARRVIDGNPETFWQPDPNDGLVDWTIEIDLGRAVLAREIQLTFPDREGARPFRQFSVYVATGASIRGSDDVFQYEVVYRTTRPNQKAEIEFSIDGDRDTTRVLDSGLEVDLARESRHRVVQYVLIKAEEQSQDAALAEVEVIGVGDNVSLGTLARGGVFHNGELAQQPQNMFDGQMGTNAFIVTVTYGGRELRGWLDSGLWWEADLGALFWIDGLYIYHKERGEALSSFTNDWLNAGTGFQILSSDGTRTISGDIDYTPLILEPKWRNSQEQRLLQFRYLFRPRKIRYLFFHGLADEGWYTHPMELMLFSEGYPAQVVLRSDFIDLGQIRGDGRPKAIKTLSWDADLPPSTRLQLRSRSGNGMKEDYTFHNKIGEVISETQWNSLPKVVRGSVDTALVVGEDWSPWSNFYQFPGETFKSESPRKFIQLEGILSTDDPSLAPMLRSVSIEFDNALVSEARGRLLPRQTRPNVDTRFSYVVWPAAAAGDQGFDLLRLVVPGPVEADATTIRVGGQTVAPEAVSIQEDSLLIVLSAAVIRDSVQVDFTTRVLRNATVVTLDLGNRDQPGLWQSVEVAERQANVVFLPELVGLSRLIGDLEIALPAFTPNGDGINDVVEIRFVVFKAEAVQPRVRIFDLAGRLMAELTPISGRDGEAFTWSGRDLDDDLVAPGIYLCHIDVGTEAGEATAIESIAVAY